VRPGVSVTVVVDRNELAAHQESRDW
jgi:hypothetical protein